jgi:aryl-alcohol dehydrogenase-like predicted oxidoreductase
MLRFGDFVDLMGTEAVAHYALAQGVNYLGTADSHSIGLSDEKLGAMQALLQTEVKCASLRSAHLKEWKWSARVSLSHQGSDRDATTEET